MASKTKKILLALLGLVAIAAFIGYNMYNKKHFSVQAAKPAATITAADLHAVFSTDTVQAKNKFIGDEQNQKVIEVTGEITEVKKDQQGNLVVLLKTGTAGAFVNCTFEQQGIAPASGSKIAVIGICTGYNFDAEMGIPGDVILTRCFTSK